MQTIGMAPQLVRSAWLFSCTPYAYAAIASNATLIITAGACPLDDQGRVVPPGDIALQTRKALDNLRIALEDSGAAIGDVLKTTIFVSSSRRDDLTAAWTEVARVRRLRPTQHTACCHCARVSGSACRD